MKQILILIALLFANPAAAQTQLVCNQGSAKVPCSSPIGQTYIPAGIPATKVSAGTVSDTVFGYLAGVTSSIQAQLNALVASAVALSNATPDNVGTASPGASTAAARADHVHALPAVGSAGTSAYATVTTDAQGRVTVLSAGAAPAALSSTTPTSLGVAAVGAGTTAARADHVHDHGSQAGGTLHPDAVAAGASGFMSGSDKTKLNGIAAGATNVPLPLSETNGGLAADVSTIGTGLIARSAANTPVTRQLVAPAAGITISNPAGLAGNPTLALADDLAAVEALAGTGIAVRTGSSTWANRSITAGTGTTVTNGDGVAAGPQVNVTYGSATGTATQGNDGRLAPAPTAANKLVYDTGTAYAETAACSSASTVLVGGSPPACAAVPDASLSSNIVTLTGTQTLTNKSIDAGQLTGTVPDARLPTTMAGKTLTTATLTAPVINGAVIGTITVPTPTPGTAQPATAAYAEAQKTGGTVITFAQSNANSWGASHYIGLTGGASGASPWIPPVPFVIPSDGIIKVLRIASNQAAPGANTVDIYRNTGGGGFVATTITAPMASSNVGVDPNHSVNVIAGDLVIPFNNGALWNHLGVSVSIRYIPNLVP